MRKVFIHVEGQTEERFVKDHLAPHLLGFNVSPVPIIAMTKFVKSGPNFKGGLPGYPKVKSEILNLLKDSSAIAVTTMYDYYALPQTFPGRKAPQGTNCYDRVAYVEQKISLDISNSKFIPFLTLHEFEGLLFSSPDIMAKALPSGRQLAPDFRKIRTAFNSPEEINDAPPTAPSSRIKAIYPGYKKPLHGSLIVSQIGIGQIKQECQHFSEWVEKLENLRT